MAYRGGHQGERGLEITELGVLVANIDLCGHTGQDGGQYRQVADLPDDGTECGAHQVLEERGRPVSERHH